MPVNIIDEGIGGVEADIKSREKVRDIRYLNTDDLCAQEE